MSTNNTKKFSLGTTLTMVWETLCTGLTMINEFCKAGVSIAEGTRINADAWKNNTYEENKQQLAELQAKRTTRTTTPAKRTTKRTTTTKKK